MLWTKVFVILCLSLDLISGYYSYQRRNHRHRHHHVYDCGYNKCVRRKSPPVCQQWCLVYFFDGCFRRTRYECCSYREKPGYCPADSTVCLNPFPYYSTRIYECRHDFNCPAGFKCCRDSCFVHKVCKPCTNKPPFPGTTPSSSSRETEETTLRTTRTTTKNNPTTTREPTAQTTTKPFILTTTTTVVLSITEITTTVETSTTETPTQPTITSTTKQETTSQATTTTLQTTTTKTPVITSTTGFRPPTTIPDTTTTSPTTQTPTTTTTTEINQPTTSTSLKTTTTSSTTPYLKTTTLHDVGGSGDGTDDGDDEVPEPEAARLTWRRSLPGVFDDDEDIVAAIVTYA